MGMRWGPRRAQKMEASDRYGTGNMEQGEEPTEDYWRNSQIFCSPLQTEVWSISLWENRWAQ